MIHSSCAVAKRKEGFAGCLLRLCRRVDVASAILEVAIALYREALRLVGW